MRRLKRIAAAITAGILFAGANTYPAQAAPIANCPDSYICFYDGTNFGTYHWTYFTFSYLGFHCENLQYGLDNVISSYISNPNAADRIHFNGFSVRFYPNDNCVGTPVPTFGLTNASLDDDLRTTEWGNVSNVMNSLRIGHD